MLHSEDSPPYEAQPITPQTVIADSILHAACLALTRHAIENRPLLTSWQAVINYCRVAQAHDTTESFRVLFLNKKNILIEDSVMGEGSIDHCPVYPRMVAKRALLLDAAAIIMVHNHPSGDPKPSQGDIEMTKQVRDALKLFDIALHDHLIVASTGEVSLKAIGAF